MQGNPYSSPNARVAQGDTPATVPVGIGRMINSAWIAALVSAAITATYALAAMSGTQLMKGISVMSFLDVFLFLGLAFGVSKKSRVCAVLLFLYFVLSKIVLFSLNRNLSGATLAYASVTTVIFLCLYGLGVIGTFRYHQLRAQAVA